MLQKGLIKYVEKGAEVWIQAAGPLNAHCGLLGHTWVMLNFLPAGLDRKSCA